MKRYGMVAAAVVAGALVGCAQMKSMAGMDWQTLIDDRRARPRDDIMSELLAADLEEEDGTVRRLTDRACKRSERPQLSARQVDTLPVHVRPTIGFR